MVIQICEKHSSDTTFGYSHPSESFSKKRSYLQYHGSYQLFNIILSTNYSKMMCETSL